MTDAMLLTVAVLVFALLVTGLILTFLEFRHGQPAEQDADESWERRHETDSHVMSGR